MNVLVRKDPNGRWVHYRLTGDWSGTAGGGFDFGGVVTPGPG